MPIRIYALAKELKIDNKKLVDICTKAGITGKGSALASLSDEEVAKLKTFLAGGKSGRSDAGPVRPGAGASPILSRPMRRDDYIGPGGNLPSKVPILPSRHDKPAPPAPPVIPAAPVASAPVAPVVVPPPVIEAPVVEMPIVEPLPVEPPAVVEEPPVIVAEVVETAPAIVEPELPPVVEAVVPPPAPEVPIVKPPRVRLGPIERPKRPLERKITEKKTGEKRPAISLAPMPMAPKPTSRPKPSEPEPQKPDIKLPLDAIRASRAGTKPLSEHIRQTEQKRQEKDAAAKRVAPRKLGSLEPLAPPTELPGAGRDRLRRGRGSVVPGAPVEEEGSTLGGREQRQLKRKRSTTAKRRVGSEEEIPGTPGAPSSHRRLHIRRTGTANTAAPRKGKVVVPFPCTVRTFSEAIGVPARNILGKLLGLGVVSNIAADLNPEMAELLAVELGVEVDFRREVALEEKLLESTEQPEAPEDLQPRPPIVTFLGHVDHGKTSLLDRIINIDVAAHEKGGITQHIRAYKVDKDGRSVTFVDTPGHEAFTEMRARGANVTDIAVLVVAADDGVMPQTEEAISHARAAGVPVVVALNKIDLPGVNIDRIFQQLATNDLLPSEWGGETELVRTSAVKGEGIDTLLDTLLTVAELHEYRANPKRPAQGTCLESEIHEDRGVVAKFIVQTGTLHVGDVVVCGSAFGRVKALYDTLNPHKKYESAGPSMPVNITGLSEAPGAGDRFNVLPDITQARQLAEQRASQARQQQLSGTREHVTLETLYERLGQQDDVRTLNIILRADVRGSIEAIRKEMGKLQHPEVQIKVLQATVGGITEADVHLADASDAVIIGFSVVADEKARALADQRGVQIRRYDIIYQVTEDLRAALEGMLKPEKQEKELGRSLVQQLFHISRMGTVAGCRVLAGTIHRDARVRVIRDSRVIGDYALDSLRREKDDVREVREGMECGMRLAGFNDLKEGDVLEAYKIEEVRRTLAETATAN